MYTGYSSRARPRECSQSDRANGSARLLLVERLLRVPLEHLVKLLTLVGLGHELLYCGQQVGYGEREVLHVACASEVLNQPLAAREGEDGGWRGVRAAQQNGRISCRSCML